MLAGIEVAASIGVREVLDHRERSRINRYPRQRHRAEILLAVTHECVTNPLAEEHATADHHPADRTVRSNPEQHADRGDIARSIHPHRDRVDVDDRHARPHQLHVLGGQPLIVGLGVDVAHLVIVPCPAAEGAERDGGQTVPMGESRSLGSAAWTEIGSPIVLIPVGSTEQHGPHLPLDTDTQIAVALAHSVGLTDVELFIGPALTITASGEHDGFPGTLSIGAEVMADVVIEMVRSAGWAASVVLVNGHGGNHRAVTAAVETLTAEGRRVSAWWPSDVADLTGVPAGNDLHAGLVETSVMMRLDPDSVRSDAITPGTSVDIDALRADGVALHSPSGVIGDPTGATAELGEAILARWTTSLERQIAHHIEHRIEH